MSSAYSSADHLALNLEDKSSLARHGTLLTNNASPARAAYELKVALGNANGRLKPGASIDSGNDSLSENVSLEQAKTRARVELDLVLERFTFVQGGYLNGVLKVRVRGRAKGEEKVLVAGGKIRVIGLESTQNDSCRHPFYLQSSSLHEAAPLLSRNLFDSQPDAEGFSEAKEGVHSFPFSMFLPLESDSGSPKGAISASCGAMVRYVVLVSLKVKERENNRRSIAHFYRDCEVWPRHNPSSVLAPAAEPNQDSTSKSLFMGGSGKVTLTAATHRLIWIAGQQCPVKIKVTNLSKKTIKTVTLTLMRSTVVFKPSNASSESASYPSRDREMSAVEKEVSESTLEMAQRVARGHASTKGWWTGVHPEETLEFSHSLLIPSNALSIAKSRLLEVTYTIRVSINAGSLKSELHVSLPIHIINFLSVDPPPTFPYEKQFVKPEGNTEGYGLLYAPLNAHMKALEAMSANDSSDAESTGSTDSSPSQSPITPHDMHFSMMQEDNEEFVNRAIGSMIVDARYGEQGGRFADLYYESLQEGLDDLAKQEPPPEPTYDHHLQNSSPNKRASSFPQRVQQKMDEYRHEQTVGDVGAQKRPVLVNREASVNSSRLSIHSSRSAHELRDSALSRQRSSTAGSYFRPREEIPDEIEPLSEEDDFYYREEEVPRSQRARSTAASNDIPFPSTESRDTPRTRVDRSSGRDVAETNTEYAVAYFHSIPSPEEEEPVTARTRTGRPRAQTLPGPGPHAAFAESRAYTSDRPQISVGAGGSVKDRIRALEEKSRVERELYSEASGPL